VHALSVFGQTLLSASQPTRRKRALTINPKSIYYEKHRIITRQGREWFTPMKK
jgi:hypothetical protein